MEHVLDTRCSTECLTQVISREHPAPRKQVLFSQFVEKEAEGCRDSKCHVPRSGPGIDSKAHVFGNHYPGCLPTCKPSVIFSPIRQSHTQNPGQLNPEKSKSRAVGSLLRSIFLKCTEQNGASECVGAFLALLSFSILYGSSCRVYLNNCSSLVRLLLSKLVCWIRIFYTYPTVHASFLGYNLFRNTQVFYLKCPFFLAGFYPREGCFPQTQDPRVLPFSSYQQCFS